MSHRPRTRLRCHHVYSVHGSKRDDTARKLTRYDQCIACGHKRRFAPPTPEQVIAWAHTARQEGEASA